jgi:hypothetical protein
MKNDENLREKTRLRITAYYRGHRGKSRGRGQQRRQQATAERSDATAKPLTTKDTKGTEERAGDR